MDRVKLPVIGPMLATYRTLASETDPSLLENFDTLDFLVSPIITCRSFTILVTKPTNSPSAVPRSNFW